MSNLSALLSGQGTGPTQQFAANTIFSAGKTANVNSTMNANAVNVSGAATFSSSILQGTGQTATLNGTTAANTLTVTGATTLSSSLLQGTGQTATLNGTTAANTLTVTGDTTMEGTLVAKQGVPIRIAGGNTVTLALTDNGKLIRCTNSTSAMNVDIPLNSSVAFPTGAEISIMNELTHASANSLTVTLTSGVTLLSKESANTVADRYTSAVLKKLGTDTWTLVGNLS